ncbi:MAG: toll/interleukin-1 receptor domain-containing protein [Thauera sp.]|nr:toll/interleukin-1 receptor domain-containing protein [Thauera sp.]
MEYTRHFSDKKFGGENGALTAAREYRDKAELVLPPVKTVKGVLPAVQVRNALNKTGHIGLHFQDKRRADGSVRRYVVAVAAPEPMKQVKKTFTVGDRQVDDVFKEALAWRNQVIEDRRVRLRRDKEAWEEALAGLLAKGQKNLKSSNRLKVFLCHSKDDKEQVRKLYLRLLALGCEPWLDDESLMPGQDWDSEIRRAIRASHVFVACLSSGSVTKRGYVQKEIRFALDVAAEIPEGDIFIIPIKLDACDAPESLAKWHWLEAYRDGYGRLISSLAQQTDKLGLEPLRSVA